MNSNNKLLDFLDVFVRQIATTSTLVPQPGLLTGKTGVAIFLYHYARYRNDEKIWECADSLIDIAMQETGLESGTGFDGGICGIAWGLDYLMKQEFVQAEENIFDEMDDVLFQEAHRTLHFYDLGMESEKGLYILNRLASSKSPAEKIWRQRMENCVHHLRDIVMLKYTQYVLPVFPCKTLIRFFHICQKFRKFAQFQPEIDAMYEELSEVVKISYREEKSLSNRYILATALSEIQMFEKCIPIDNVPQLFDLEDVSNFYLTGLILGQNISIPKAADKMILSIAENHQLMNELLNHLNPDNAGLGNYMGGLAWAILQYCINI